MKSTKRSGLLKIAGLFLAVTCAIVPFIHEQRDIGSPAAASDGYPELSGEAAVAHLKQTGEFSSLGEAVKAAIYNFESNSGSVSVNNSANRMAGRFDGRELLLQSTAGSEPWKLKWRMASIGYGDSQSLIPAGKMISQDDRVEIHNAEYGLVEWYKNTSAGLEQGFVLENRPGKSIEDKPLRIVLINESELKAESDASGLGVTFTGSNGVTLRYENLKAWDAEGRYLNSKMRTDQAGEVWLEVEDSAAIYPITVDPTFAQTAKLTASDAAANDFLGWSIAISGNTVVVGAPETNWCGGADCGSAYVFVRNGANWSQQQKLNAPDGRAIDFFGESVAIDGDLIIVGASKVDIGTSNPCNCNHGAAYIYSRSGTTWSFVQKLVASDYAAGHYFGIGVGIRQNRAVVGADGNEAVYVFEPSGSTWVETQKLTASDSVAGDAFGTTIAVDSDGETFLVGAPYDDTGSNTDQGSAYVFSWTGTNFSQQQKLTASDGSANDLFGLSVAILKGTAVAGAQSKTVGSNSYQGAAYVYTLSGSTWTQQQKLTASNGAAFDKFGRGVSIAGNTVIVSAEFGGSSSTGAAYVFKHSGSTWIERQTLLASDGAANDHFGYSISSDSRLVAIGASDHNGDRGAAYIYQLNRAPFDFDGDNKTDISVFRPSTGYWYVNASGGGGLGVGWGLSTDVIVPGDYTGDSKDDLAIWRPSTGEWYILRSDDFSYFALNLGSSGDTPVVGDFDADGKVDNGVYRPSTSTWYIDKSSGGSITQTFGTTGDVPVVADYDGDAKSDIGVFRPSTGEWRIDRSSLGFFNTNFGVASDKLVQADYTGDDKADIAVWRPSTGVWYILKSDDGSWYSYTLGSSGDIPTPGDYDGDGKSDYALFRPSNATWYLQQSTLGYQTAAYGLSTDKPVPNAFVP